MHYRKLGNTGMEVSVVGLGGVQLASSDTEYAVKVVRKALELGVNYFDTARVYFDSEIKLGIALKGERERVYISTKTTGRTKEDTWQHIRESLQRLQTDYLDNCHIHALDMDEDIDKRLGPGGAIEALVAARDKGLVRHIGCSSHRSSALIKALEQFDFEIILASMNIVEREPLEKLIPLCISRGIGITIMKPLATGLLPAPLALKWLLNQPISTAVPGATTLAEASENSLVGHLDDFTLTPDERDQANRVAFELDHVRCRLCGKCEPCPVDIPVWGTLGSDDIYNHYRTMGPENFRAFPWSRDRVMNHIERRRHLISKFQSCNECGICEDRCPYGLPIVDMLRSMVPQMEDMLRIWSEVVL
ncbi:aldo/keto reductase [Candidatus Poribacteria bacterium]